MHQIAPTTHPFDRPSPLLSMNGAQSDQNGPAQIRRTAEKRRKRPRNQRTGTKRPEQSEIRYGISLIERRQTSIEGRSITLDRRRGARPTRPLEGPDPASP
jgi:hypothetical protein